MYSYILYLSTHSLIIIIYFDFFKQNYILGYKMNIYKK